MKKLLTFVLVIALVLTLSIYANCEEITAEITPDINDNVTVTEAEEKGIIDTIMNSTVWGSIIAFVAMAGGVVLFIHKKFGGLISLVKNKADTTTIKNYINTSNKEIITEIKTKLAETEQKLAETQENEKNLLAILSMYIMNDSRYNSNAKAEIMKYITGIKGFTGTVAEICEQATDVINKANEAEVTEPTPALDSIIEDVTTNKMMLG